GIVAGICTDVGNCVTAAEKVFDYAGRRGLILSECEHVPSEPILQIEAHRKTMTRSHNAISAAVPTHLGGVHSKRYQAPASQVPGRATKVERQERVRGPI